MNEQLPIHIEEYIKNNSGDNAFRDLFQANKNDLILKSEFNELEVDCINKIYINNVFLMSNLGNDIDIYGEFLLNYMKLKVSFNRGSRIEFVDVNKKDRFENNLSKFNNFQNLAKVKE